MDTSSLWGTGLTAASDIESSQTKAGLEDANALIAQQQAKSEMAAGSYNANLVRQRGQKVLGSMIASTGANNLQQKGTPVNNQADTARATELSALMTNNNALRRAWGFQVQGASDRYEAGMDRTAGVLNAAGAIVGSKGVASYFNSTPSGPGGGVTVPTSAMQADNYDPNTANA